MKRQNWDWLTEPNRRPNHRHFYSFLFGKFGSVFSIHVKCSDNRNKNNHNTKKTIKTHPHRMEFIPLLKINKAGEASAKGKKMKNLFEARRKKVRMSSVRWTWKSHRRRFCVPFISLTFHWNSVSLVYGSILLFHFLSISLSSENKCSECQHWSGPKTHILLIVSIAVRVVFLGCCTLYTFNVHILKYLVMNWINRKNSIPSQFNEALCP